ncbi:hypothetical protein ACFYUM_33845 [Streptomyces fimicarius]|uniref:Secreted protein n=1 Tax=Streptomyces caviscabies TaxID=90079 RepID=A0ABW2MQ72_9ACTN|nr:MULTISPECIES: hypothetical protein [Streptomyces]MCX4709726.1 hypothetical protein [Streptomyces griseus]MDX3506102.1 hypothetical protein [Streptomyces sp. ATCC51928]MDX5525480.1 hypothetical protein [Streptomyces sp. DE06-01C]QXQ97670.1 hypothetical protein KV381_15825 [Streptomyces sp. WY228]WKN15518.1 hypothetical protein NEH83_15755 [Streptomyces sp. JUS-F4]
MPRGRHRHSPPLHRILPPSVVAGVSVAGAAGAWLLAEPLVLRGLVAAVAAAAVTGAYLMRSWDRAAGLRVAELTRARASDEWRAEERIAELEQDLEESRELRTRLETKLRRKRVELAGLRGEHAGLLRRYANAETERASALEGRRQLAIEAAAPKELLPARSTPTPESYRRADEALKNLTRNAALQETRRTVEAVRQRQLAVGDRNRKRDTEAEGPQGKHAAATGAGAHSDHQHRRPATTQPAPATEADALPPAKTPATEAAALPSAKTPASIAPVRVPRAIAAASAVVPYAARRQPVPQGNFDFFGTQNAQKANAAIESVQNEDLADVVGEEALAAHRTGAVPNQAVGKVIDLTAHDETEQIDVAQLRGAVS